MFFSLSNHNGLKYKYLPPVNAAGYSFVCFNPLTGDKAMWEDGIGPGLIDAGHGMLTWNLRGQAGSPFSAGEISQEDIVADAISLLKFVQPKNPVFVGLSIGGLYAAKVHLSHQNLVPKGFVLINTLRKIGPRLAWINAALVRLAETGDLDLLRDTYLPLLMNEDWQTKNRPNFLRDGAYTPIDEKDGSLALLKAGEATSWDIDWGAIDVPILNITGLQDHVFRDDAVIKDLLKSFKTVKPINYDDAGHMIPAERPERLSRDILTFVNDL